MDRRTGKFGADDRTIDQFKATWPCHGFPDDLACILAEFDSRGDLVDLEGFDDEGNWIDTADFDGPALAALVEDIQAKGYPA